MHLGSTCKKNYLQAMLYENLQIRPEDLPDVFKEPFNGHPKRYLRQRLISLSILFLVLGVGVTLLWMTGDPVPGLIATSIWTVLLLLRLFFEFKSFPLRGYFVREQDISYRSGILFREVTTVPYNRIQHSEVSQGPLGRAMKLSTLKIFTAGGSASDLSIHGLETETAERLKAWLTEKTAQHV